MHSDTAHRGRLLYIALGSLGLDVAPAEMPPELHALHAWRDTWQGIGLIEHGGLARRARDLSLTRYRDRWGFGARDGQDTFLPGLRSEAVHAGRGERLRGAREGQYVVRIEFAACLRYKRRGQGHELSPPVRADRDRAEDRP